MYVILQEVTPEIAHLSYQFALKLPIQRPRRTHLIYANGPHIPMCQLLIPVTECRQQLGQHATFKALIGWLGGSIAL